VSYSADQLKELYSASEFSPPKTDAPVPPASVEEIPSSAILDDDATMDYLESFMERVQ
jgi:hypothetical protein